MKLINSLRSRGAHVEEFPDRGSLLRAMWEITFLSSLNHKLKESIYISSYLWHAFSYKKLDCLKGEEAAKAFNELDKNEYYIFYQHDDEAFVLSNTHRIKAEDFNSEQDVYVVDKDFTWTYINTHESYCGPYFYERE